jgi:hypothetical protein
MFRNIHRLLLMATLTVILLTPGTLQAETSVNVGWHNPPGSDFGLNLMFAGNNLALELGVGTARGGTYDTDKNNNNKKDDDDDTAALSTVGDIDLKYLFSGGSVRPYIQGGFGLALAGSAGKSTGASASTGDGFAGAGVFFKGSSVLGYIAIYAWDLDNIRPQAGIGIKL